MTRFFIYSNNNDEETSSLEADGYSGSLNDMQLSYLTAAGFTSGALNDRLKRFLELGIGGGYDTGFSSGYN